MKNWFRENVTRDMIRPILYKSVSRMLYLLTAALLWDRFLNRSANGLAAAFVLIAFLFAGAAWLCRLRRSGVKIPSLPQLPTAARDRRDSLFGDMIDHIDTPVVNFTDLDPEEQNLVLLLADSICAVLFLTMSFFV